MHLSFKVELLFDLFQIKVVHISFKKKLYFFSTLVELVLEMQYIDCRIILAFISNVSLLSLHNVSLLSFLTNLFN